MGLGIVERVKGGLGQLPIWIGTRHRSRLSVHDREVLRCVIIMLRLALKRLEQIYADEGVESWKR